MKIEPTDTVIDLKGNTKVKEDITPIIKDLVECFLCIHDNNPRQYRNNLIMLQYHVKGFKEVCNDK